MWRAAVPRTRWSYLPTASLNDLPTLTFGTVAAGICISSPVEGLRPVRAARSDFSKERKPGIWT
jgi:hypothetical protein